MATSFPGSLDSFVNPSGSDALDSVSVPHASQHADVNDAVEALQAKVGVDGSAVTTSLDYKVARPSMPACFVSASGISVSTSSNYYVPFASEDYDPFGWHDNSTNNTRITPNVAGWYLCTATVNDMNPTGANYRALSLIRRNRASGLLNVEFARFDANNYAPDDVSVAGVTYCNGTTDYLEHLIAQYSGTTKTVNCQLTVTRISG